MSLKRNFGTSKEAITEGIWIDICENDDGSTARIRIKRMNQQNRKYQKEMANHRKAFNDDHFSEKKIGLAESSMIDVLINTVIVDWENMQVEEVPESAPPGSKPTCLEFSKANARKILNEFPDLLDLITNEATDLRNFQSEGNEVKN